MKNFKIVAAAHFFNEGDRGLSGGAPQNDKVWGLAMIGNTLVRFWGRREGKLKFKTEVNGLPEELLQSKLAKGYREMSHNLQNILTPRLQRDMPSMYFSDLARGRVNTQH